MISDARLLSASRRSASVLLALVTFAVGLGVGAGIQPVTARLGSNGEAAQPAPVSLSRRETVRSTAHPAEVLRVIDGDTFEARVHLWPGLDVTTLVRLRGIDAPERRARCDEERDRADAARNALRDILDQGEVAVAQVMLGKYGGRVLANASTHATPDVAAALLATGLVRRYEGGRRGGWC